MTEKMTGNHYDPDMAAGDTIAKDVDAEFDAIIEAEFGTPDAIPAEPFLMGRMILKDVGIDDRHMKPSTNKIPTWTPTDDGRRRVDAITYGDND